MQHISKIVVIFFIALLGCIDRLPLPDGYSEPRLVVDGMITQEPGPHTVNLFMTGTGLDDNRYRPVSSATLTITNNLNETVALAETSLGVYQTPINWLAQFGKLYRLNIQLADGREYISEDQLLYTAGKIDTLRTELKLNSINRGNLLEPQHTVSVSIDSHGEPDQPNLFRWRWRGIYEIFTYPDLHEEVVGMGRVVVPLPCSGIPTGTPCTCCSCWVTEQSQSAHVSVPLKNVFQNISITSIPVTDRRFFIRYYIEVEQLSLSNMTYEFWKRVHAQQEAAQNIFQPNAIKILGNIKSVTNPDEEVFGIFSVSGIDRQKRFLDYLNIGRLVREPVIIKNDCQTFSLKNSSTVRPSFW